MTGDRTVIGDLLAVVERYDMDAAEVWDYTVHGWFHAYNDRLIRIEADPDKRQGTRWIFEEVEV